ncbi:TonB-dependent receptor [Massilia sp. METH4]|uniref:TonB-dependent receptor plug domain-containing protein n=1 Tax=Massilia sp. METH4 TaxID=3123041 RepID=UPI0030CD2097
MKPAFPLRRPSHVLCLCALPFVAPGNATAQDGAQEAMQRVEVKGSATLQLRRDDAQGRIVVGGEELRRFGDTGLSGALKRQPGLSVSGSEVRMRGLGAGYTQILLDGQPAPAGFAIDSLSPELVERIEIQRSAQADASAQAIAGSINIVLRKAASAPRRATKLGVQAGRGGVSPAATLQGTWRDGVAAYALVATVDETRRRNGRTVDERSGGPEGAALRRFAEREDSRVRKLGVAPRFDWQPAGGDTLALQGLFDASRNDTQASQLETTLQGESTASPDARWRALYERWLAKVDGSWSHRAGNSRLTVKGGLEASERDGDYHFHGVDAAGVPWLHRAVDSRATERRASTSGKLTIPLAAGHDFAFGWDGAATRRGETRAQRDSGPDGLPFHTLDQQYRAQVRRLAWFAQDEWAAGERVQVYLGLRWESLDTRTAGRGFAGAATASRVWSPVAQVVWRPASAGRDQVRLALARTYKAPQPAELVPRRYTVNNGNGPTTPDYQGNPLLRPELAWGLDLAWEAYFARGAMASVATYARRVRDVTMTRLWEEGGTWVSEPVNGGKASVRGIEFDGRLPLGAIELRANLARNWSRADALPGPANRLANQAPLTANLGIDAQLPGGVKAGANANLVGGWQARSAPDLVQSTGMRRELEAYASWRATGGQWKATLAGVPHMVNRDGQYYDDGTTATVRQSAAPRHATFRLQYEAAL